VEKIGSGVEDALLHFHEGEVRANGLRVEIVPGAADGFGKIAAFVVPYLFRTGIGLLFFGEQHIELAFRQVAGSVVDLLDEVGDVLALGDHLVGGVVIGPGGITEERGDLVARLHKAGEDFLILGVGAGVEGEGHAAAQRLAFGEGEHGVSVGIIGGEVDFAVRAGLVAVDVILGQAVEFRGIGRDDFLIVGNIAIEHGLLFGGLIV
jgi:hypothetical protein